MYVFAFFELIKSAISRSRLKFGSCRLGSQARSIHSNKIRTSREGGVEEER